jgi:hypothetical protein
MSRGIVEVIAKTPRPPCESRRLRINVVFTTMADTAAALKRAVFLAAGLDADTQIAVPHVVPFPLPLEYPAVSLEFACSQLKELAAAAGADPYIHFYLCRDAAEVLEAFLPVGSIVVVGLKRRWLWRSHASWVEQKLRKAGCDVVVAHYQ